MKALPIPMAVLQIKSIIIKTLKVEAVEAMQGAWQQLANASI